MNLTQTEYAERRGVSGAAVSKWIKQGKIPKSCLVMEKCSDGKTRRKIVPDLADKALDENLDETARRNHKLGGRPDRPSKKKKPGKSEAKETLEKAIQIVEDSSLDDKMLKGMLSLAGAQRATANFKAQLTKTDLEERKKILVNRQQERRKIYEILRQTVTDIQALPRKSHVIAELVALETPEEIEDLLQKVIFDLLSDLADVVENMEKELGL